MNKIIVTSPEELQFIIKDVISKLLPKEKSKDIPDTITLPVAISLLAESGFPTSKAKIYKLTSSGELPHRKYGNKLVFSRRDLLQWAELQMRNKENSYSYVIKSSRRK